MSCGLIARSSFPGRGKRSCCSRRARTAEFSLWPCSIVPLKMQTRISASTSARAFAFSKVLDLSAALGLRRPPRYVMVGKTAPAPYAAPKAVFNLQCFLNDVVREIVRNCACVRNTQHAEAHAIVARDDGLVSAVVIKPLYLQSHWVAALRASIVNSHSCCLAARALRLAPPMTAIGTLPYVVRPAPVHRGRTAPAQNRSAR
jgi:hypothetical protein